MKLNNLTDEEKKVFDVFEKWNLEVMYCSEDNLEIIKEIVDAIGHKGSKTYDKVDTGGSKITYEYR